MLCEKAYNKLLSVYIFHIVVLLYKSESYYEWSGLLLFNALDAGCRIKLAPGDTNLTAWYVTQAMWHGSYCIETRHKNSFMPS